MEPKKIPSVFGVPWTEADLRDRLREKEISLFPAELRLLEAVPPLSTQGKGGVLEVCWEGADARFAYVYTNRSSPNALEEAIAAARDTVAIGLLPLVIVPYLPEKSLRRLEEAGLSGFDLCGNGRLRAPGFALWRSGEPNRFREPQPYRNVYRGKTSLLTRAFLLQTAFPSLTALRTFALDRFQLAPGVSKEEQLTKGTVSKVVQALTAERIVSRSKAGVSLLAPALLLDNLHRHYVRPRGRHVEGKMSVSFAEAWSLLAGAGLRTVATGTGSAGRYGLLSGPAKLSLYVDEFEKAGTLLQITSGRVFPNIELVEETSDLVYFDARKEDNARWASPIQTYLELADAGPREKEAAEILKALLLKGEPISLL